MILEGLVSTIDSAGSPHVSAMGPTVDDSERQAGMVRRLVLRPFATSQTAANLLRSQSGVFHLTDDVLLMARVVAGSLGEPPLSRRASRVAGFILDDACRAWEFEIDSVDDSQERLWLEARIVAAHDIRPFWGFNRGAHAVVEAAILVTRLHLLDAAEVRGQLAQLAVLVEKTGGPREREAFSLLEQVVESRSA